MGSWSAPETRTAAGERGGTSSQPSRRSPCTAPPHAIGLTGDQHLVEFDVAKPTKSWSLGKVSGLSGDTKLVGIGFRVQNEELHGVGDKGGTCTPSTSNAKAMKVSQPTVALAGTAFGVDFNPAADRLRVTSDTDQNLRHDIDDAAAPPTTTVDGTLANPTTPPSTAMGSPAPPTPTTT